MLRSFITCLTLGACVLLCAPAPARAEIRFETGDFHPEVGAWTRYRGDGGTILALGDLDGDGREDVIVHNRTTDTMWLLRCGTDHRLEPGIVLPLTGARGAAIWEVDGDGRKDLVTSHDARLEVRRQGPDGVLSPPTIHPAGPLGGLLELIDLDHDQRLDAVVMSTVEGVVMVMMGTEQGGFGPPAEYRLSRASGMMVIADLDGDGHADLCAKEPDSGRYPVQFLRGRGDGGFEPEIELDVPPFAYGFSVGDLDGDGDLDIAANGGPPTLLLENDGSGHFTERARLPIGPGSYGYTEVYEASPRIADLDSDGRPDIVHFDHSGFYYTMHDLVRPFRNLGGWNFAPGAAVQTLYLSTSTVLRDLDGDGHLDVVTTGCGGRCLHYGSGAPGLMFIPGKGEGRFAGVIEYRYDDGPLGSGNDPGVRLEFVPEAGTGDALRMISTLGTKTVRYSEMWPIGPGPAPVGSLPVRSDVGSHSVLGTSANAILADLNGDGHVDRLDVLDQPVGWDSLMVEVGRGDGTFEPAVGYALLGPSGYQGTYNQRPNQVAVSDLNRDGDLDAIVLSRGGLGFLSVLLNDGQAQFADAMPYSAGNESCDMLVFDADQDLVPDVFACDQHSSASGRLLMWRGIGDGTFEHQPALYWGDFPMDIATGDFDDDGLPDIAYYSLHAHTIAVGLNAGRDLPTPAHASLVSAAFEDGAARLVWQVAGVTGAVTVQRSDDGAPWADLARLAPDGDGRVRFDDPGVLPGHRHGWRLALDDRGAFVTTAPVWLDIPGAAALALAGASPNPVAGDLVVAFTLPSRDAATLALFDLAGRRVAARAVGTLGPGSHRVRLAERAALAPGLYFVRLATRERTLIRTAVVVR